MTVFGDPLEVLWVRCVFAFCGVDDVRRRTFGVVVTSTDEERAAWLEEAAQIVDQAFCLGDLLGVLPPASVPQSAEEEGDSPPDVHRVLVALSRCEHLAFDLSRLSAQFSA